MLLGMRSLTRNWQVGDGREEALAAHVLAHARANDLGVSSVHLSLSHDAGIASAVVVCEG